MNFSVCVWLISYKWKSWYKTPDFICGVKNRAELLRLAVNSREIFHQLYCLDMRGLIAFSAVFSLSQLTSDQLQLETEDEPNTPAIF